MIADKRILDSDQVLGWFLLAESVEELLLHLNSWRDSLVLALLAGGSGR